MPADVTLIPNIVASEAIAPVIADGKVVPKKVTMGVAIKFHRTTGSVAPVSAIVALIVVTIVEAENAFAIAVPIAEPEITFAIAGIIDLLTTAVKESAIFFPIEAPKITFPIFFIATAPTIIPIVSISRFLKKSNRAPKNSFPIYIA